MGTEKYFAARIILRGFFTSGRNIFEKLELIMAQEIKPGIMAEQIDKVTLAGQPVAYNIRRSPKAKHIRFEVRSDTGLTVVIPTSYDSREIPVLIKSKERWILEKLEKYKNVRILSCSNTIKNGDSVLYLGRDLEVVAVQSSKNNVQLKMEPGRLVVAMKQNAKGLSAALERWYRKQAACLIEEKAKKISARMGITYSRISIRGQKTRWGSCSNKGNLSFNWKLIKAPEPIVDYVVIHELAHLTEMNHSKRFWQIVENHCPRWREHRKWLKEHVL